jgi:hypothetical protein
MAIQNNPKIITSDLIMYLDAANSASYPGTGITWYDLSNNNNNGTLYNSPAFSRANKGVFVMNGSNTYIDIGLNLNTSNFTVIGASRYTDYTAGGRTFSAKNNNWFMGHVSQTTENYYADGWVSGINAGPGDNNWRVYAVTGSYPSYIQNFYINGKLNVGPSNAGNIGPDGFRLGTNSTVTDTSKSHISFIMAYNRILNADEIQQNYNALRGRFNL